MMRVDEILLASLATNTCDVSYRVSEGAHVAAVVDFVLIRFVSRIPPRSLEEIHSTRDVRHRHPCSKARE